MAAKIRPLRVNRGDAVARKTDGAFLLLSLEPILQQKIHKN